MNLNDENRGGYVVTSEMKKVWSVQLTLLQKLLDVCHSHGLRIWIDGGSLLGAVREKGYIPWDDDIDTIMMRDDYNRLMGLADEFEHPFFLQSAHTDRLYPRGHAQLRMQGTAAILRGDYRGKAAFNQSIFIDIFVLDGVPDSKEERMKAVSETKRRHKELLRFCQYRPVYQLVPYLRWKLYQLKSFEKCFDWFEESYRRFDVKDHKRIYNWTCCIDKMETRGAIMREWYDETVMLPFEDIEVPAPAGYHEVLTALYGDYMKPSKQPNEHGQVLFDTERPYTEVLAELDKGSMTF